MGEYVLEMSSCVDLWKVLAISSVSDVVSDLPRMGYSFLEILMVVLWDVLALSCASDVESIKESIL